MKNGIWSNIKTPVMFLCLHSNSISTVIFISSLYACRISCIVSYIFRSQCVWCLLLKVFNIINKIKKKKHLFISFLCLFNKSLVTRIDIFWFLVWTDYFLLYRVNNLSQMTFNWVISVFEWSLLDLFLL